MIGEPANGSTVYAAAKRWEASRSMQRKVPDGELTIGFEVRGLSAEQAKLLIVALEEAVPGVRFVYREYQERSHVLRLMGVCRGGNHAQETVRVSIRTVWDRTPCYLPITVRISADSCCGSTDDEMVCMEIRSRKEEFIAYRAAKLLGSCSAEQDED